MMARKKAGTDDGAAEQPAPKEKTTALPNAKLILNLLAQARKVKEDVGEIAGELGAAIKDASDNKHLNKKAFGIVKSLDRMEPERLADCLEHLDDYLEKGGLRKRAGQVMRMPLDGDEAPNVRPFPQPRGEAAE
jgi:hypothetical protein